MKELILSNGKTVMVENESYPLLIVVNVPSYSDVDGWKAVITEENINGSQMDEMTLQNLVLTTMNTSFAGDYIRVEFLFREMTESEIMAARIDELEDAVNFLLMGGDL